LRQGIARAQRASITCGSSLGGRETKPGATGKSKSGGSAAGVAAPGLVVGTGADDFLMQFKITIFQEQLANPF
jgi:hypothetical protein